MPVDVDPRNDTGSASRFFRRQPQVAVRGWVERPFGRRPGGSGVAGRPFLTTTPESLSTVLNTTQAGPATKLENCSKAGVGVRVTRPVDSSTRKIAVADCTHTSPAPTPGNSCPAAGRTTRGISGSATGERAGAEGSRDNGEGGGRVGGPDGARSGTTSNCRTSSTPPDIRPASRAGRHHRRRGHVETRARRRATAR